MTVETLTSSDTTRSQGSWDLAKILNSGIKPSLIFAPAILHAVLSLGVMHELTQQDKSRDNTK
jgi:hypothetical protein